MCRAARFNLDVKDVSRRPDLRQEARKQRALSRRRQPEFATGIDLFSEVRWWQLYCLRLDGITAASEVPPCRLLYSLERRMYVALLPARRPLACFRNNTIAYTAHLSAEQARGAGGVAAAERACSPVPDRGQARGIPAGGGHGGGGAAAGPREEVRRRVRAEGRDGPGRRGCAAHVRIAPALRYAIGYSSVATGVANSIPEASPMMPWTARLVRGWQFPTFPPENRAGSGT